MPIETKITKAQYDDNAKTKVNDTDLFSSKAKITLEMINRWGMVSAMPDGEDSSGRSKLRLMTEEELINRAFNIADLMFNELEVRGWLVQTATFEELDSAKDNILEEAKNRKQAALNHK